jgi:hypothetical protein
VRREDFRDALRRAAEITGDRDLVVLGSQSVHGSFNMAVLQDRVLTASMEIDFLTSDDPDGIKIWALPAQGAAQVGVELDGVEVRTSALPEGWVDRLVPFPLDDKPDAVIAWCLEPHDLVVAKAIAGRDKDWRFIRGAVAAALVDPAEALRRSLHLDPGTYVPRPESLEAAQFFLASLHSAPKLYRVATRAAPKGRPRPRREQFMEPEDMYADLKPDRPDG